MHLQWYCLFGLHWMNGNRVIFGTYGDFSGIFLHNKAFTHSLMNFLEWYQLYSIRKGFFSKSIVVSNEIKRMIFSHFLFTYLKDFWMEYFVEFKLTKFYKKNYESLCGLKKNKNYASHCEDLIISNSFGSFCKVLTVLYSLRVILKVFFQFLWKLFNFIRFLMFRHVVTKTHCFLTFIFYWKAYLQRFSTRINQRIGDIHWFGGMISGTG